MFTRLASFWERNERRLSLLAFVGGFLWDNLMLTEIDRLRDQILIFAYLVIAFTCIVLLNAHRARLKKDRSPFPAVGFIEFAMQFALGGLFSIFIVFFSRSGAVLASLPFLLVLGAFFVGNELFKKHYERLTFQMSVFFAILFSYSVLVLPVILGDIGDGIFILSGCLALVLFWLSLRILRLVAREEVEESKRVLLPIVGILLITFNVLYFNNMIPPIPLSLKDIGVYHSLARGKSGEYVLGFEKAPWYEFGEKTASVFHKTGDGPVYVFSSIYAPTRLDTPVVHRWLRFNEDTKEWTTVNTVSFIISGGRADGFRGYSSKETITTGKWRVNVETPRGQIIGRFDFTVEDAVAPPTLSTETR